MKNLRATIEKFELYVLSLWLLFFLVIVVTLDIGFLSNLPDDLRGWVRVVAENSIPLISLVFLLVGAVYYFRFEYKISGSTSIPVNINDVQDLNYEHLTFLTTYIIPLVCLNLADARYVVVLGVLLVVIGVIYVKTDKFYANPSLSVLGFKLYSAEVGFRAGKDSTVVIITKSKLKNGSQIKYIRLDDRVIYAKEA